MADPTIPIVNAYWSGNSIVAVSRTSSASRVLKRYPAEYCCFLRKADVTPELSTKLRAWSRIKAFIVEGDWIRLRFASWRELRESTSKSKYPNEVYGGYDSVFDRLGLTVYEADVNPVRRFLTENPIEIAAPKRCYFDIEADSRVPFSRKEDARILCWSVVDHETGAWEGGILDADTDEAERELLSDMWDALDQYDQVCAWNGDRYDFPVIKERSIRLGLQIEFNGWLWLDHLDLFKRMNLQVSESGDEKQSFALGKIATEILGETKDDLDAAKTWEYWSAGGESREQLFRYNVRDSDLLRLIEKATGYIDTRLVLCQVCHTLPDSRGSNGTNFVEGYLLRMGRAKGIRFRTNWTKAESDAFEGAYVMEPTRKGILHNVHVADFAGMYPSIIQTWNISPETVRADVVTEEDAASRPAYLKHLPLKKYPLPADVCTVPGGCCFSTTTTGLIPLAIGELKSKRKYWADMKASLPPGTPEWHDADRKSNAYKVCANTFYGVMGATTSRFYDPHTASSVTAAGRWLIHLTLKAAEDRGWAGIYSDTDSCFVMDVTEAEFRSFTEWCNNELYPNALKELQCPVNEIKIAYEKEFSTIVLVGKKRYAGRFLHYKGTRSRADSKPEVKGLEYKRGDSVKLARTLQYEAIMALMNGDETSTTYEALAEKWRQQVVDGELAIELFAQSKTLSKDMREYGSKVKNDGTPGSQPIHVEVAKVLAARGVDTGEGVRIEYVVVDGHSSPMKAIPISDYTVGCEDRYYLWEKLVWPPTERILECAFPAVKWHEKFGKVRPKVVKPVTAPGRRSRSQVPDEQRRLFNFN